MLAEAIEKRARLIKFAGIKGKTILRDYIKATVGFEKLGEATDTPPKSLSRMFGPRGNPQARNLFSVSATCRNARVCSYTRAVNQHLGRNSERSEGIAPLTT